MKLARDSREFVELLSSHHVDYVIVGGHAVAYHGYPRFTGDIDVLVRPSTSNAHRVLAALKQFGFGNVGIEIEDLTTPGKVIQLGQPPNRIDIVTRITGVDFDDAWSTKVTAVLDGIPVFILGREGLLKNKRATGRAKDLADVEALESELK
ncbi:MAG: DUF6036 family nucleotidyltransferase [Myxococcota bacterium]